MYYITHKIYKTLREYPSIIVWKKMKKYWGLYEYDTQQMSIDFRCPLVPTIIHECIHHWNPEWSETKVLEEERRIVNSMTPAQGLNLMKIFLGLFNNT